jgi:putative acetyltransferase
MSSDSTIPRSAASGPSPVQVRAAVPSDADGVCAVFACPRVIWGTLQLPHPSPETWRRRLADADPGNTFLVAVSGTEIVGTLGLHSFPHLPRRAHAAFLGMGVRDSWQGRGVGTALMREVIPMADRWLNLSRLELNVYTDNEAGIRLYRKFGFEVEGTLRRFAFRDGAFADAYAMARLRPGGSESAT